MHRALFLFSLLYAIPVGAIEARYALVIGANHGARDEAPLSFAHDDAGRVSRVLREAGGFAEENVVVLEQPRADRVREVLAHLNARIRTEVSPGGKSFLMVFYSGHADALALHLGGSEIPWDELRDLTASSAAAVRLLVIDSCRSGQATQVKGTRMDAPFSVTANEGSMAEGFAILAAATAGESAQESVTLRGSFFTHHLVSALRGAADTNHDGVVSLTEAYLYTADRTLASSAQTLSGLQHPTYHYAFKGRADIDITRPGQSQGLVALRLDAPGQYLIRGASRESPLLAEANVYDSERTLWLPAGPYFVQHREPARLLEGYVTLPVTVVPWATFQTVQYAQLVRKGGDSGTAVETYAALRIDSPLLDGFPTYFEPAVSVAVDTAELTFDVELSGAVNTLATSALTTQTQTLALAAGARKVFDLGVISLSAGLRAGALAILQTYDAPRRVVMARRQIVPTVASLARAEVSLYGPVSLNLEGGIRASLLKINNQTGAGNETVARVQGFGQLGVGVAW